MNRKEIFVSIQKIPGSLGPGFYDLSKLKLEMYFRCWTDNFLKKFHFALIYFVSLLFIDKSLIILSVNVLDKCFII